MGVFDFIRRKEKRNVSVAESIASVLRKTDGNPMAISAVYRCVDVISDSVAALPLVVYRRKGNTRTQMPINDALQRRLNEQPDERMSRFTFIKTIVASVLLRGNGYAYVDRDGATPKLRYIESGRVSPIKLQREDGTPYVEYNVAGYARRLQSDELIHILNFSYDGLVGVSTLTHATNALSIAKGGDAQVVALFQGGGQPSGILANKANRLNDTQRKQCYDAWNSHMADTHNGVVVLDGQWEYQPISINPADQQLLESREFSVVEICRFFGVNPVKCFDLSKSSYSTVEATQLSFLTDTLTPILENIEQELNRKLFLGAESGKYEVQFDTSMLLRADKNSQANYYRTLVMCGIMTPNEVRAQLGLSPISGGDVVYMQTNMSNLENLSKVYDESGATE